MQTFILCSLCAILGLIFGAILQKNREINYKKHAEYYKAKCKELNDALLNEIRGGNNETTTKSK